MRIMHKSNIDFSVDNTGKITRKSTWNILPDNNVLNDWPAFAEAARVWAGKIGDKWRIPTADSQGYTEDDNYVITDINFSSDARFIYNVEYQGAKKNLTVQQIGGVDIEINENDERTKTAHWLIHAEGLNNWLPKRG